MNFIETPHTTSRIEGVFLTRDLVLEKGKIDENTD